jgi:MYXO-CTERM domain-containing protein
VFVVTVHQRAPDAGLPDEGVSDAGSEDAGVPDAGLPGEPDAGALDAGGEPSIDGPGDVVPNPEKGCASTSGTPGSSWLAVLAVLTLGARRRVGRSPS